ncbi:uncharacterized protein LOC141680592 isoform X2 [Apium graveolens]
MCHGFRSTKEFNVLVNLAAALEMEGISVFRFDFAGNGESEGSFEYGNYRREAEDLRAVVLHFNGMNRPVTAVLGHSKGGNVVLLYASKYHDVHTVVNLSGRFNLQHGMETRLGKSFLERIRKDGFIDGKTEPGEASYRITEAGLMDRLNTNMNEACVQIEKDCRVLIVHGSADEVVPVEDALSFGNTIHNHKIHIVEGADHCYTSHQDELGPVILPFIKDGLQQHKYA